MGEKEVSEGDKISPEIPGDETLDGEDLDVEEIFEGLASAED